MVYIFVLVVRFLSNNLKLKRFPYSLLIILFLLINARFIFFFNSHGYTHTKRNEKRKEKPELFFFIYIFIYYIIEKQNKIKNKVLKPEIINKRNKTWCNYLKQ